MDGKQTQSPTLTPVCRHAKSAGGKVSEKENGIAEKHANPLILCRARKDYSAPQRLALRAVFALLRRSARLTALVEPRFFDLAGGSWLRKYHITRCFIYRFGERVRCIVQYYAQQCWTDSGNTPADNHAFLEIGISTGRR